MSIAIRVCGVSVCVCGVCVCMWCVVCVSVGDRYIFNDPSDPPPPCSKGHLKTWGGDTID